jgi:hypothetical protein
MAGNDSFAQKVYAEQRRLDEQFALRKWACAEQAAELAARRRAQAFTAATVFLWSANAAVWIACGWLIWDIVR